jgi:predicted dehydrogenase
MKVGIMGAGVIAVKMAKTLGAMKGAEPWAVASRDYGRAKSFAETHGVSRAYGSYGDLLADPRVDLVYIATPHSHHHQHIKLCLDQGKPVLCEKSFTLNAAQAREALALGKEKGLLVAEAIWTRYLPMRKTLEEVLAGGAIGKPVFLTANLCNPRFNAEERRISPDLGGGALLDMGVYTINFALMAFGGPVGTVQSFWQPYATGVDAQSTTVLGIGDKTAVLTSSILARGDQRGIIAGEGGYIVCKNILNCEGIEVYDTGDRLLASYAPPPQITGFEYEVAACKRALEAGALECPEMPHAEIIRVMETMDRIRGIWGLKYPGEAGPPAPFSGGA